MAASALWTLKRPASASAHGCLPARRPDRDLESPSLPHGGRADVGLAAGLGAVAGDAWRPPRVAASTKMPAHGSSRLTTACLPMSLVRVRRARPRAARTAGAWRPGRPRACRWNSRCSWVTLVCTATSQATSATRSWARPWLVDSTTANRSPPSTIARRCAWSSGASGVVARPGLPRLVTGHDDIDGPEHAGRQAARLEHRAHEVGRRGLAVGARDAHDAQPMAGVALEPRRGRRRARGGPRAPAAGARRASGRHARGPAPTAPAATAAGTWSWPSWCAPGTATNTSPGRTRRESCVTPPTATSVRSELEPGTERSSSRASRRPDQPGERARRHRRRPGIGRCGLPAEADRRGRGCPPPGRAPGRSTSRRAGVRTTHSAPNETLWTYSPWLGSSGPGGSR